VCAAMTLVFRSGDGTAVFHKSIHAMMFLPPDARLAITLGPMPGNP
jgi:hypothetical protein